MNLMPGYPQHLSQSAPSSTSTPSTGPTLITLPAELLTIIFDFLRQKYVFTYKQISCVANHTYASGKSLSTLCRTCRRLYQLGTPVLYGTIYSNRRRFSLLARTFSSRPDLVILVRQLYIVNHFFDSDDGSYRGPSRVSNNLDENNPDLECCSPQNLSDLSQILSACAINLRVLSLEGSLNSDLHVAPETFKELRKLRNHSTTRGRWKGSPFLRLLENAPQLTSLNLNESVVFDSTCKLARIDDLTLDHCSATRIEARSFNTLNACQNLKSFTYKAPCFCVNYHAPEMLLEYLEPHQKTLQTLRLESDVLGCSYYAYAGEHPYYLKSLNMFSNVRHLSISTSYFFEGGELDLLHHLPTSIQTLEIIQNDIQTRPDLQALIAEALADGQYPDLEKLTLIVPGWIADPKTPYFRPIREVCVGRGLMLSINSARGLQPPPCWGRCRARLWRLIHGLV